MTQRIFKKSCKQDMIDLFNILPDCVKNIQKMDSNTLSLRGNKKNDFYYTDFEIEEPIIDIDFETEKVEEMIIERPNEE